MRSPVFAAVLLAASLTSTAHAQGLDADLQVVPDDTVFTPVAPGPPKLDQRCVVSVLNRTSPVQPDGTFILTNLPSNFGPVRARATCLVRGTTVTGQSGLFSVPPNGRADTGLVQFDAPAPIPTSLSLTASTLTLNAVGATSQLTIAAVFASGPAVDVTADPATTYVSSNSTIATVGSSGVVTAVSGGAVVITVLHEGVSGFIRLSVSLATTDTDGDGIPDGVETANGLDPNDSLDGFLDPDNDGLSNKEELVDFGTNPNVADTDGDGLSDAEEVRTRGTNPVAADTDGDGVRDGLEVQTGSDPRDPTSLNLAAALSGIAVTPPQFVLTVNTIVGEASVQLAVVGTLRDGTTIDLTAPARGTAYASSDLAICSFGTPAGRVFAGANGTCTITVTSNGFSTPVRGRVQSFAPRALSFLAIPGYANNVDVSGNVAYVAAGSAGLRVVNVANRSAPQAVGSFDTAGNANDVRVVGSLAYVADGANGLVVIDVANPAAPALRGTANTPGIAQDVVGRGTVAYVADGAAGLQLVDVTDPMAPSLLGAVDTPGSAKGVDLIAGQPLAVVADGTAGIKVIDVSNPAAPAIIGAVSTGGDARDVVVQGGFAFVADFSRSFTSVDIGTPTAPVVRASLPSSAAGLLMDVAAIGRFALGADVFFVNAVPIVDVATPATPVGRTLLDFSSFRDDNGTGIAADARFVYLTADPTIAENGTNGSSRLYVGEYLAPVDAAGVAPSVQIVSPASGATVIESDALPVTITATDDVAVTSVDLFVDGTLVRTLTTAPFQHTITVPTGVSSLTLRATAIDFGNNVGATPDVILDVIPDPRTTVTGRAIDQLSNAVAGATVTCLGVTGSSAANGNFSIPNVPTIQGNVQCSAIALDARGRTITGSVTDGAPVRGGATAVGNIVLSMRVAFGPGQVYFVGGDPQAIASGDFNSDGARDLVTSNAQGSSVGVLLGNGNGTFRSVQTVGVGGGANAVYHVIVGDLDRDGNADIVASANGSGGTQGIASVIRGRGDGTFFTPQTIVTDRGGGEVAIGEFNGDGRPDVVRFNRDALTVAVLLGNGDGTLTAAPSLTVPVLGVPVAVGDLHNDGKQDIVVGLSDGTLARTVGIFRGNGDGTFQAPSFFTTGASIGDVVLADVDRNGALDLITSNFTRNDVSVYLNVGDGTLGPQQRYPAPDNPLGLAVGDVNRDGFPDVATSGFNVGLIGVLLGEGNGTLLPAQTFDPSSSGGFQPLRALVIDTFNADALPDIATPTLATSGAWVILQQ